jgi:hypothetical protein
MVKRNEPQASPGDIGQIGDLSIVHDNCWRPRRPAGAPLEVSVHLALAASGITLGLALFASLPPVPRIVLLVLALALGALP